MTVTGHAYSTHPQDLSLETADVRMREGRSLRVGGKPFVAIFD